MADERIGENITAKVDGKKIVITIEDKDKVLRESKSQKNNIVASTGGNIQFGGVTIGLNAYKKKQ